MTDTESSEKDPFGLYCCPCRIVDHDFDVICLWGDGEDSYGDHFVTDDEGKILSFRNKADAERCAASKDLDYADRDAALELSPAVASFEGITDCELVLNRWNDYGDAAHSVGRLFIGDEEDSFMNDLYTKVFAGCNLPSVIGDPEPYVPEWRPGELVVIAQLLDEGRAILREGLGFAPAPDLEIAHFEETLDAAWGITLFAEPPDDAEADFRHVRLARFRIGEEQRVALLNAKAEIPYSDGEGRILSFPDEEAATSHAASLGMEVSDDVVRLELSPDHQFPGAGAPSAELATAWEVMSQVAWVLDMPFVGNFEDGVINVCLRDLDAEGKGTPYGWKVADLLVVYYVLNTGWGIIAEALGFSEETFAEALSAAKRAQRALMDENLLRDSSTRKIRASAIDGEPDIMPSATPSR